MSVIQSFFKALLPRAWAQSMEEESRAWQARCADCGHERSIWELGGIRWKAAGNPRRRIACPKCERATWHVLHRPAG